MDWLLEREFVRGFTVYVGVSIGFNRFHPVLVVLAENAVIATAFWSNVETTLHIYTRRYPVGKDQKNKKTSLLEPILLTCWKKIRTA